MSFAWQTVEQAAVTLGISTRTIARRIAKGELESRLNAGRREVFIPVPEMPKAAAAHAPETIEADFTESDAQPEPTYEDTIRHTVSAASTFGADVETSTALILAEDRARRAEMAISVIQQSTAIVRDEVHRARFGARWAWGVVGVMAAGVIVAVGWTTRSLTQSQQTTESLRQQTALISETSEKQAAQLKEKLEKREAELASARVAAAKAEGQLQEVRSENETVKAQLAAKSAATNKPSTVVGRVAQALLSGD